MSKGFRSFIILLFFVLLSIVATLHAQDIAVTTRVNSRVRAGPGTTFDIIGGAPEATTYLVIGRNEDTTWLQIVFEDTLGWISVELVDSVHEFDSLPVVGTQTTSPTSTPTAEIEIPEGAVLATNSNNMNIRSGPSTRTRVIGQLPNNSTIIAFGRWGEDDNLWLQFEFEDESAWIAGWLMDITGNIENVPIVGATLDDLLAVCENRTGVPQTTNYTRDTGIHPVLLVDTSTNRVHTWNDNIDQWTTETPSDTQLIACIDEEQDRLIQTCPYNGPDIERFRFEITARLIVAQTGQTLSTQTLRGDNPRQCRQTEPYSLVRLEGTHVTTSQLEEWLMPFVDRR